jgi:hypothetical protein
MKKVIFLLIFILQSASAFSATNTAELAQKSSNSLLDNFSLEFVLATEQTLDSKTHEPNGMYTSLKNSLLYKASANNELRFYASHVWERFEENQGNNAYWELAEVMYRRKNILNQKDHFVNLELELKNYWVMDTDIKNQWGFDGAFIPQLIFKKSFGRKFGVKTKFRRHFYDRNRASARTLTKEDRIYLSSYYMFNRKLMFNAELKYRHKIYTGKAFSYRSFSVEPKDQEITTIHPGLYYFVNRQAMLEVYVETTLNDSTDERTSSNQIKDEQLFGAALYLTAF